MTQQKTDLQSFAETIGHRFSDLELLAQALTHPSSMVRGGGPSNQRFEFLGDRVLGLTIAESLLVQFPEEGEGEISRRHSALVRRDTLADVARAIGLGAQIYLAKSEEMSGGRDNPALLADCCEALIAAIYLDGGLEAAQAFVARHWQPLIDGAVDPPVDAKTALQEWAQARGLSLPRYKVTERSGPDHAPEFTVEVRLKGFDAERAIGATKRAAEQAAANALLVRLASRD